MPEVIGLILSILLKAFVYLTFSRSVVDDIEMALVHLRGKLSAGDLIEEYSRVLALDPASDLVNSS